MKRIMVFGVFDGLHPGHMHFLKEAAKHGNVIAVVARDSAVRKFKSKSPKRDENERLGAIRELPLVREAVLGDKEQGTYEIIKTKQPDIICLGYDQDWLEKDLKEKFPQVELVRAGSYEPDKMHSSILNSFI